MNTVLMIFPLLLIAAGVYVTLIMVFDFIYFVKYTKDMGILEDRVTIYRRGTAKANRRVMMSDKYGSALYQKGESG